MVMMVSMVAVLMFQVTLGFAPLSLPRPRVASTSTRLNSSSPGLIKTISKEGTGPPLKRGDQATVKYSVYLPDSAPFARSERQRVVRMRRQCFDQSNASLLCAYRNLRIFETDSHGAFFFPLNLKHSPLKHRTQTDGWRWGYD